MLKLVFLSSIVLLTTQCNSQTETTKDKEARQKQIIQEHVYDCADKINYLLMMKEYQACLDAGLKKDATIAYLWQQKAMPYFKVKKYEVGMEYLDQAVKYDKKRYLPYRAFIKCIFAKTYRDAIIDFEECIANWGDNYEMDHTYSFYIGLSYLQLNEFKKAEQYFQKTIEDQQKMFGKDEVHHLDLFYQGITKYELGKYEKAITLFNAAIDYYPTFSDAIYYKALCYHKLNKPTQETKKLIAQAEEYAKNGFTINEDNAIYEPYPYQVRW